MGNILYGDMGSEHMIYLDEHVQGIDIEAVSSVVYSVYSIAENIAAGYIFEERRSYGIWGYVNRYNSRKAGYFSGYCEKLQEPKHTPSARFAEIKAVSICSFSFEK